MGIKNTILRNQSNLYVYKYEKSNLHNYFKIYIAFKSQNDIIFMKEISDEYFGILYSD